MRVYSNRLVPFLGLLLLFTLWIPASWATAQEPRQLFERGARLYDDGEYTEAARLWERAWSLEPRPALQYNLAQAYERLGRGDQALAAYERYLQGDEADTESRRRAERRAAALSRRLAAESQALRESPPSAVEEARPPPLDEAYPSESGPVVGPVMAGVAALCAVAAIVTGGLAVAEAGAGSGDLSAAYALATATDVLGPTSVSLGVAAAVLWVFAPETGPSPQSTEVTVLLRGEFP